MTTQRACECVFRAVSGGTGSFVVASAITGYFTPAQLTAPAIVNGGEYFYRAESSDLTQHEFGRGVYDSGTSTLTRATILQSSNSGNIVTFSEAPKVGLVLSNSEPLIESPSFQGFEELGPELVTNGGFTGNADGWTLGAGWAYDTNKVTHTSPTEGPLTQDFGSLTTGGRYQVQFTVSGFSGDAASMQLGNAGETFNFSANGSYSEEMTAGDSGLLSIDGATNTFSIDDVSVRAILSGPATKILAGDGGEAMHIKAPAIYGDNITEFGVDADGNVYVKGKGGGASFRIYDPADPENASATFGTGNLTDHRVLSLPDVNGTILVDGESALFTSLKVDNAPIDAAPSLELESFWNDGGVAFRGLFIDITDTASDPASRPFGIDIDGIEVFTVRESEMYVLGDLSSDGSVFAANVQSDDFVQGSEYRVGGTKVVGAQQTAVADAAGGAVVDTEARAALNSLLAKLRTHGLIAT